MNDVYKTIAFPSEEILFKEKNSKFYGYAFPINSEEDVKALIDPLKKKHFNAVHFCYAFQTGTNPIYFRANDDGEPSNSAGMPIYGQIQSFGVTNILVVIVRYFGGTKLGVPGLINAYKTAAKLAIENAMIAEMEIEEEVKFAFDYAEMNNVMRILKKEDPRIINQNMLARAEMTLKIREDKVELLKAQLELVKSLIFMA